MPVTKPPSFDLSNTKELFDGETSREANSFDQPWDLPLEERTGDKNADTRRSLFRRQVKQAVASGDISPQRGLDIWNEGHSETKSLVEEIFGLDPANSRIQNVADVFMLGTYGSASLAQARTKGLVESGPRLGDPGYDMEGPPVWEDKGSAFFPSFSTEEFSRSWSDRTSWGHVLGTGYDWENNTSGALISLAADIALDPTTYLTFGVSSGTKVLARGAAVRAIAKGSGERAVKRVATETAVKKAGEVTLTRWGERMYQAATRDLLPKLEEKILKSNSTSRWGSAEMRTAFHEEIADHMVKNYSRLAKEAVKRDSMVAGRLGRALGRPVAPPVRNMFRETAELAGQDIGLNLGVSRVIRSVAKEGSIMESAFRMVNKTYGMDFATKAAYAATSDALRNAQKAASKGLLELFDGTTLDDRVHITKFLEAEVADSTARNSVGTIPTELPSHLKPIVEKVRLVFDDIAAEELKHNVLYDTVEGYVTHFLNHDLRKVEAYMSLMSKHGVRTKGNSFAKHRSIATIDAIEKFFGKGAVLTDVGEILARRKKFSLDLIYKQRFYDELSITHGTPAALIEAVGESVPDAIRGWFKSNRESLADIANLDQFWSNGAVKLDRWGFKNKDTKRNLDVIKWMSSEVSERDIGRGFVTDHLSNWGRKLNTMISTKLRGGMKEVDANDVLASLYSGDVMGKLEWEQLRKVIIDLDNRMRKRGIGPLKSILPDVISKIAKQNTKRSKSIQKLDQIISRPVEGLTKDAFLPEEMALRAANLRLQIGIFSDIEKPSGIIIGEISNSLKRLGFKPGETSQLLSKMFDKKSLKSLSAKEADSLDYFLRMRTNPGLAATNSTYLAGEKLTKVTFAKPLGLPPTIFETNIKSMLSKVFDEDSAMKAAYREANEPIVKINENIAKLKNNKRELARLRKIQKDKSLSKVERSKATVDILNLISESGSNKAIDAEIIKLQNNAKKLAPKAKALKSQGDFFVKWKSFLRAQDRHTKRPTEKTKKAVDEARKKLKSSAKKHKRKFPEELTPLERPKAPRVRDERFTDELYREGTEDIAFEAGKLKTARDYGTVGPHMPRIGAVSDYIPADSYYFPASIASLIEEINKPLYNPNAPKFVNSMLRGYDFLQNLFKAPLMAPFAEFYKRNVITNVMLAHIKAGAGLIRYMPEWSKITLYTLGTESIDLRNLPRSAAASLGTIGAATGAFIGAAGAGLDEDPETGMLGGVIKGGITGLLAGAAYGAVGGKAIKEDLAGIKQGILPARFAGASAGGLYGLAEGEDPSDVVLGAAAGYGAGRALGKIGAEAISSVPKFNMPLNDFGKLASSKIELRPGVEFTVKEWAEEAAKRGVFSTHVQDEVFQQTGSIDKITKLFRATRPEDIASAIAPANSLFMRDMFRAGELASEIPTRLMLFTTVAKQSGSMSVAARAVKDYLFDYSKLSMFERRALKRFMPFYSWSKHALTATYDSIINHTGRTAAQMKFFTSWNKGQDYDPGDVPDWLRNRLSRITVIPSGDGGKEIVAKTGYGLAIEDTIDLLSQARDFGAALNPWSRERPTEREKKGLKIFTRGPFGLTSMAEQLINRDFFRGGKIQETLTERSAFSSGRPYDNSPTWLKNAVGYRVHENGRSTVDPRFAYLMQEIPPGRFLSLAQKVNDSEGDMNWLSLARQILGEKLYRYGPEQKLYYDRAKLDRMAYLLKKIKDEKGEPMLKTYTIYAPGSKTLKTKTKKKKARKVDY